MNDLNLVSFHGAFFHYNADKIWLPIWEYFICISKLISIMFSFFTYFCKSAIIGTISPNNLFTLQAPGGTDLRQRALWMPCGHLWPGNEGEGCPGFRECFSYGYVWVPSIHLSQQNIFLVAACLEQWMYTYTHAHIHTYIYICLGGTWVHEEVLFKVSRFESVTKIENLFAVKTCRQEKNLLITQNMWGFKFYERCQRVEKLSLLGRNAVLQDAHGPLHPCSLLLFL